MERIRSTAVAILLCVALLAASCADDGGGADKADEPPTTLSSSTSPDSTTTVPPVEVGVDDLLGTQAVQDFTIHFGLWTLDGEEPIDLYDLLLDHVSERHGEPVELVGGFTFATVDELDARVVDPRGRPLPTLSVDFGLLGATPEVTSAVRTELVAAFEEADIADALGAAAADGDRPVLVEIVTADYASARTHIGPGDRSEVDVTFLDELQPGDPVVSASIFGQTIPGDPAVENGLSPTELFRHRWAEGLIRVVGDGLRPPVYIDTSVAVNEGSTILSRETKQQIAVGAGIVAAAATESEILDRLVPERRGPGSSVATAEIPLGPATDVVVVVRREVDHARGGSSSTGFRMETSGSDVEPSAFLARDFDAIVGFTATLRFVLTCRDVAAALVAGNEAGRRGAGLGASLSTRAASIAGSISERTAGDEGNENVEGEGDEEGMAGESSPPDGEPPGFGCVPEVGPETPPGSRRPGGGMAYGDVRITTMDGTFYTNNAAGEFVLYEDEAATVQMRLEPWASGRPGVSVATAAAIAVDGHELSLHLDGSAWIDGEPAEFERGEIRALGAAEVTWWGDGWVIVAPDGTLIRVDENVFSFVIRVDPADVAAPVGLLGDADGDPSNDLVLRDGTPFDGDPKRDFERLYAEYIESWRITADESLFHYGAGESTDSFTIEGFPTDRAVIDELTDEEREMGEEACEAAGIVVEGDLLDACIVDVAVTGEPALALDSFDAQILTFERELALVEPDPVDASASAPGDTLLTISDETLVFGKDPPNQRPQGLQPSWNCEIIGDDLFADGRIDLSDGPRYELSVQYLAAEPRFSLVVRRSGDGGSDDYAWVLTNVGHFADSVDDVSIDGSLLTASGEIYVNDPPQPGLAPFSQLPDGATLDPFTLDLDCVS